METENKNIEKLITYEMRMMQIFSELQLKPNQCQLVRAFIILSNGRTEFEASFSELEALTNKKGKSEGKTANVRNALKTLLEWQDKNQIELIRVLKKGQRFTTRDGKFNFRKSKYKLILISDLAVVINVDSERFETVFGELMEKIRADFKPSLKLREFHPNHNLKRARKTIETKIKRVFELSKKAGRNPINECKRVLNNVLEILQGLEMEETEKTNREKFITEFETLLGWNETEEETKAVTE